MHPEQLRPPGQVVGDSILRYRALQKPGELAGLVDVLKLYLPAPAVIVEIGSDAGGTLYTWSQVFPDADVCSITLQSGPFSSGRELDPHGAHVIDGNSHDEATMHALDAWLDGREVDFVFIDGDHTYDGCCDDVRTYGACVRLGGLLALHDVCHHDRPDVDVEGVWRDLPTIDSSFGKWRQLCEVIAPPTNWGGIGVAIAELGEC